MGICKECEIINSFNNAWRALCQQYDENPDEEIRIAINLLSKIIIKAESEFISIKKKEEPHQITLEEWLSYINADT